MAFGKVKVDQIESTAGGVVNVNDLLSAASTNTLTNKTLTSPVLGGITTTASGNAVIKPATNILEVQGDATSVVGKIQLNCHVNTHGQKIASQPHYQAATNTLLLPGGTTIGNADAVLVSDVGTQTLTNKTIASPTLTGDVTINAQGDLRLADSDSSHYVALQSPATVTSNVTFTLPGVDGTNGQVLGTNGSGVLSFSTPSGGTILYNRRPALHRGPLFTKTAATTISVSAGAVLNGQYYASATAVTMGTHTNNTDMAVWQHPTTGALISDASFVTAPAGATGGSIVGGYHYIPSGRPTAFNSGSPTSTAEILEFSIWDLTFRPTCPDPRGMTCVDQRFWCDLYLCGNTSFATTAFSAVPSSKIGLTIADNSSPALIPSFYGGNGSTTYTLVSGNNPGSWYNFAEVAHSFGKRYMHSWEFQAAAFGAPEAGSRGTDPGTVIWERQSKWGLAQATGTMLVWAIERVGIYTSGANTNTGGRGTEYADAPRALILGGAFNGGAISGSRAAYWFSVPSDGDGAIGARFAAEHLVLG